MNKGKEILNTVIGQLKRMQRVFWKPYCINLISGKQKQFAVVGNFLGKLCKKARICQLAFLTTQCSTFSLPSHHNLTSARIKHKIHFSQIWAWSKFWKFLWQTFRMINAVLSRLTFGSTMELAKKYLTRAQKGSWGFGGSPTAVVVKENSRPSLMKALHCVSTFFSQKDKKIFKWLEFFVMVTQLYRNSCLYERKLWWRHFVSHTSFSPKIHIKKVRNLCNLCD